VTIAGSVPERGETDNLAPGFVIRKGCQKETARRMALSYCALVRAGGLHPVHTRYHGEEYGFPVREEARLFERLVLEINQAGLSWETILKRQEGFRQAYHGFDVERVAAYTDEDVDRLLSDVGIIRNRLKVNAAIENARRLRRLRETYGSFADWLDRQHPRPRDEWVKVFRKTFVFTGGEIVNEFLVSTGYLPGAHDNDCPCLDRIQALRPPWAHAIPVP
jgi:DNA-3-methyladenine glycosylase I